jgi:hypothetical protein
MNTPDHTPACAESPHVCICSHTFTVRNYNDEPVITLDQLSMDKIAASPEADLFNKGAEGSLVAAGGWGLRQNNLTAVDLPEITVARGGIKWPSAAERLAKVKAELNTALENARFWRRSTLILAGLTLAANLVTVACWVGWF